MSATPEKIHQPSISMLTFNVNSRLIVLFLLTMLVALVSLGVGAVSISVLDIVKAFLGIKTEFSQMYESVLWQIRLPRILLGLLVGGVLAVTGAVFQSLFRNPLADPALLGISGGAATTAAFMIVYGSVIAAVLPGAVMPYLVPIAAFTGALTVSLLIFRIGTVDGVTYVPSMLLAGIAMNAITGAITGIIIFSSDDQQLRDITFWLMGGLGRYGWEIILPSIPLLVISLFFLIRMNKELNILCLGEVQASHLGIDVDRMKKMIIIMVSLGVGTAVSLTGVIGFIGLVAPHLVRLALGPDHRTLIPACFLLGGSLLILADNISRTIIIPQELPVGLVTAFLGGPFFIYLLVRKRGKLTLA